MIPGGFIPAVDQGVAEAMEHGTLAEASDCPTVRWVVNLSMAIEEAGACW